MYGLAYTNYSFYSPQFGVRADFSYGKANQTLTVESVTTSTDVDQTSYGVSLLYRHMLKGASIYGGPRLGQLDIKRKLNIGNLGSESNSAATFGAIFGIHMGWK